MSELRTPGDVPPPGHKGWIPALADVQGVRILSSDSGGRRGVEPVHQGLAATLGAFAADVTAASCRPQLMSVRALELGRATQVRARPRVRLSAGVRAHPHFAVPETGRGALLP